jgi:hypothetical protein
MHLPQSDDCSRALESIERITPRTYFTCRTNAFWVAMAFVVGLGTFFAIMQAFFSETFLYYMLPGISTETIEWFVVTQVRGVISIVLIVVFMIAFLRRSALARYAVYFATCFVAFNLTMDLGGLAVAEEGFWAVLASAHYLVLRPFFLGALLTMAVSMSETARFERKHVPPGAVFYEHRKT